MSQIERIKQAIMADPQNVDYIQSVALVLSLQRQRLLASISSVKRLSKNPRSRPYWKDKGDPFQDWLGVQMKIPLQLRLFWLAAGLWIFTFQGMVSQEIYRLEQAFAEKWHPQFARITRYPVGP